MLLQVEKPSAAVSDQAELPEPSWRLGYRPALDGVRAGAILAVMGYHAASQLLKGGFLGVDIFFVLSGFLITTLLLQEWSGTRHIALRDFYSRRARRLLPALFVTIAAVGVIYAADPALNRGLHYWAAAFVVVFYSANWIEAFAHDPGRVLSLLDHTWSLAIEEQFYILWPPLLLLCLGRRWPRHRLLLLALALSCGSALTRALLWEARSSSHIYFRSDARADGLLLGCTLAIAWSIERGRALLRRWVHPPILALVAVSILLLFALYVGPNDRFVFLGGLSLVALCSAVVIAHVVANEHSLLTHALRQRPVVWIGARSYGMYLFHIPIFVALARAMSNTSARFVVPVEVALTMLAAAASYRWIESPFLRRKHLRGAPPHVQRAPAELQTLEPEPVHRVNPP
jgi:peptidoglycan/LPS O-acetylase OafA/YrhL